MQINGLSDAEAAPIFADLEREIARLEGIFSLYQTESELSQLNRAGRLAAPSPELLEVLSLCGALHAASDGLFDPSLQPLWWALAQGQSAAEIAEARRRVGWQKLRYDAAAVELPRGGALTLNGIAQGAITDRVAALLRARGLRDVLVDMGEIAALGQGPKGAWAVGVAQPDGTLVQRLHLTDRALATSAPGALALAGGQAHILGPEGQQAQASLISVSAPSAALADGLSTTLCLTDADAGASILAAFAGAKLELRQGI
jgi:thiamine biosynthesis lipoprotein